MYSKINVLEPVSKPYVFGCARRLKQHSTAYSMMQKSMVEGAMKRQSCSKIEERKGPALH